MGEDFASFTEGELRDLAYVLRHRQMPAPPGPVDLIRLKRALSRLDLGVIFAVGGWGALAGRYRLQIGLFASVMSEAAAAHWKLVRQRIRQQDSPLDAIIADTTAFYWQWSRISVRGALHFAGWPAAPKLMAAYRTLRPAAYATAPVVPIRSEAGG